MPARPAGLSGGLREVNQRDGGIRAATSLEALAVSTDIDGYLLAIVKSRDDQGLGDAEGLGAALETVELRPDAGA